MTNDHSGDGAIRQGEPPYRSATEPASQPNDKQSAPGQASGGDSDGSSLFDSWLFRGLLWLLLVAIPTLAYQLQRAEKKQERELDEQVRKMVDEANQLQKEGREGELGEAARRLLGIKATKKDGLVGGEK